MALDLAKALYDLHQLFSELFFQMEVLGEQSFLLDFPPRNKGQGQRDGFRS